MFFPLTTSEAGRKLIESFEGCKLTAYKDQRGIPTIGYGHTAGVQMGETITQMQADEFLEQDLKDAEFAVNIDIRNCVQNQFDAMVSLCFNIGEGNFRGSTLVRLMNTGDVAGASRLFLAWNKTNGQANDGLTRRRNAEMKMFLGESQ